MTLTRRAALAFSTLPLLGKLQAQTKPLHGLSVFGDLSLPADFTHFPYVNPNAPKGGVLNYHPPLGTYNQNSESFNSFNMFILRGAAPYGLDMTHASLMESSGDEEAVYPLLAKSVSYDDAKLNYTFALRDTATFHDGSPITADDVVFSFETFKREGHPTLQQALKQVESVNALNSLTVKITLAPTRSLTTPLLVAGIAIISKKYYTSRPFNETTLDIPPSSGAYKVGKFEAGRYIEYERVKNWWGANVPSQKGKHNFDTIRVDIYKDRDVEFEAFKAKKIHLREEYTSRLWATGYDFPAVKEGLVKREELPNGLPNGTQGWYMNMRREKFKDIRVREALATAFDYQWVQKNIQYNLLHRIHSFFQNSDMEAKGVAQGAELALLEPFRAHLPPAVFGDVVSPPLSDGTGQDRNNLRKSLALLKEAGWELKDGTLKNAKGESFTIEFLDHSRALVPHIESFTRSIKRLGIECSIRTVDPSQYQQKMRENDFDIASRGLTNALTPNEGLKSVYGSEAAKVNGSLNISGLESAVVDALIEKATKVQTREELNLICRALDRVLRAQHIWIPHWTRSSHFVAYWDMFERPARKPKFSRGFDSWWMKP